MGDGRNYTVVVIILTCIGTSKASAGFLCVSSMDFNLLIDHSLMAQRNPIDPSDGSHACHILHGTLQSLSG